MLYAEVTVGDGEQERNVIVGPFPHDEKDALHDELVDRGERVERLLTLEEFDKERNAA